MLKKSIRNNRGFTIIEIVVVLVLISIIAAVAFQRSISTDQMNFRSQFDKIINQVRYPQSMAMKRSEWWGLSCDTNNYWMFTGTNETIIGNRRALPGHDATSISLSDLDLTGMTGFTVIFDKFGRSYSPDWTTPLSSELSVNVTASGYPPRTFTIQPETGLVR